MNCKYIIKIDSNGHIRPCRQSVSEAEMKQFIKSNSKINPSTECWVWGGYVTPRKYGVTRFRSKVYRVHRLAWILFNGPIPEKMEVCHTCDNPPCCNPDHLFIGTHGDNMQDAKVKKRLKNFKGELHWNAKLTEDKVKQIRKAAGTHLEIAKRFGVCDSSIGMIKTRKTWRHI